MYRNNFLYVFSDYSGSDIGIYKKKKSREIIRCEDIELINIGNKLIARELMKWLIENEIDIIYNYESKYGIFNHLGIRENEVGEYMLIYYLHNEEGIIDILNKLRKFNYDIFNIKSVYYQLFDQKRFDLRYDYINLIGNKYLEYNILDKVFKINPGSFFQINTKVYPIMYSDIVNKFKYYLPLRSLAGLYSNASDDTIFLDLYCGVGIMSILMSEYYNKLYGVEINKNAIEVAKINAKSNGINNITYICSSVEDAIDRLVDSIDKNIVIFINPSRRGIYKNVIEKLNEVKANVKGILYLSCCEKTLKRDLELFNYDSNYLMDYDMFPGTKHREFLYELT